MQKSPNIYPYFVQQGVMREWHYHNGWCHERNGLTGRGEAKYRRELKKELNRHGRRVARHDLKKGLHDVRFLKALVGYEVW